MLTYVYLLVACRLKCQLFTFFANWRHHYKLKKFEIELANKTTIFCEFKLNQILL